MKTRRGFSYIEIIIALSIFAALLLTVLPLINQAGRNLAYAQDGYDAHLAAQSIMLAARGEINASPPTPLCISAAETAAYETAAQLGQECYRVWLYYGDETIGFSEIFFGADNAPDVDLDLNGFSSMPFYENAVFVFAAVYDNEFILKGRAVGVKTI